MMRKFFILVLSSCLFAGCATGPSQPIDTLPQAAAGPTQAGVILGSGRQCLHTPERTAETAFLAPFATALVGEVVKRGVGAVADWIERRREEREKSYGATFTARGFGEIYNVAGERRIDCVMIFRGRRGAAETAADDWRLDDLKAFGLAEPPEFFLELSVETDAKKTAFRFVPQRLEYRKTAAVRSRGSKDLLVVGVIESPYARAGAEEAMIGTFDLSLPAMREGTVWDAEIMEGLSSQWIPMPPVPRSDDDELLSTVPISVLATVEEAEEGSDLMLGLLQALSSAAQSTKDTVSEKIAADIVERLGLAETEEAQPAVASEEP